MTQTQLQQGAHEIFQMVREVTSELLQAQHQNRILSLENEQLRRGLRRESTCENEQPPVELRQDSRSAAKRTRGTQCDIAPAADAAVALRDIELELDAVREAVVARLRLLASVESDLVGVAACNAEQHRRLGALQRTCDEHSDEIAAALLPRDAPVRTL
jgi:hypothetical protein